MKIKVRSWRTHIMRNHVPFRKDCQVCQEAAARGKPHKRQKLPARAGVLSIDVAGPLRRAGDLGKGEARFILVGALTWPTGYEGEDEEEEVPNVEEEKEKRPDPGFEELDELLEEEAEGAARMMEQVEGEDEEKKDDEEAKKDSEEEYAQSEPAPDQPKVQMHVYRMAIPMETKSTENILRGIVDMYLMLRSDGFQVTQLHSDRGGEFLNNVKLEKWCRERSILQTYTSGADPMANGRAERAVQAVKMEVRKMLLGAKVGLDWWPVAVRHLNERWRRQRIEDETPIPPLMAEVIVRRRYWRTKDLEPVNEKVKYLAPSWVNHGHWILRPDNSQVLTRAVITNTKEPITDEVWLGIEDALTPMDVRRRIRGKMFLRRSAEEDGGSKKERLRRERLIQEEAAHVLYDDEEVATQVLEATRRLQSMEVDEEADVLQTKIVSPNEVRRKAEKWREAIQAEITSLFHTKEALKILDEEKARKLTKEQKMRALPSKVVFTVKPDPNNAKGKLKCRIVACGNFAQPEEEAEYFAAGADSTSLRLAISWAGRHRWIGINLDYKTAFLNAPWKKEEVDSEAEATEHAMVLLKPPSILVHLEYFQADQFWEVLKAVYGFRQSPRLWSDHRDSEMKGMKVKRMKLWQMDSDPCMWLIKEAEHAPVLGIVLTYVDDVRRRLRGNGPMN